jgi:hypothetical protein
LGEIPLLASESTRKEVKKMIKEWATLTTNAVSTSLKDVIGYIPEILGALVVVLVGVLVAWAVKTVIVKALSLVKIKPYTDAIGLNRVFAAKVNVAELLGDLAKWIIVIISLLPASEILGLKRVSDLTAEVVSYLPNVVVAVVIVMVGVVVADLLARVVESAAQTIGASTAAIAADVTRWIIVVFVVLAALLELGIATTIIATLITAFFAMLAIAGGLAFGLGGQEAAKDVINRLRKNL